MLEFLPRTITVIAVLLVLAGVAFGLAGERLLALLGGGLGGILLASALFYAVGKSEDADRERGGV